MIQVSLLVLKKEGQQEMKMTDKELLELAAKAVDKERKCLHQLMIIRIV